MGTWYTIREVCALLQVTRKSVYRWIHAHRLKAVYVGNKYLIKKEDLQEFIEGKPREYTGVQSVASD